MGFLRRKSLSFTLHSALPSCSSFQGLAGSPVSGVEGGRWRCFLEYRLRQDTPLARPCDLPSSSPHLLKRFNTRFPPRHGGQHIEENRSFTVRTDDTRTYPLSFFNSLICRVSPLTWGVSEEFGVPAWSPRRCRSSPSPLSSPPLDALPLIYRRSLSRSSRAGAVGVRLPQGVGKAPFSVPPPKLLF